MKLNNLGSNKTELVRDDGTVVLFSYNTPVAALLPSGRYVRTKTKYSVTTSKHINQWLTGIEAELVDQSFIDKLV